MAGKKKDLPQVNEAIADAAVEIAEPPSWRQTFLREQEELHQEEKRQHDATIQALLGAINNQSTSLLQNNEEATSNTSTRSKLPHPARPTLLDVNVTYSKFLAWRSSWNDYSMLQKLHEFPESVQKADLRSCLSEEMKLHIKCAMNIEEGTSDSVTEILDKIQLHLRQKRNVALDRVAFEERKQEAGEHFDDFYVAIKNRQKKQIYVNTVLSYVSQQK